MKEKQTMIDIRHLDKHFGRVHAVNDISFCVNKGELFAFLGLNGAGKSTTISIICGFIEQDGGDVFVDGLDIKAHSQEIKSKIGVVYQDSLLDKALSVRENLASRAALYGIMGADFEKRLKELADQLDFADILKRPLGKLSGGQRRRIDVARALLHRPELLILDEPTTGLDPQTRRMLWDCMTELRRKENVTVFLTTHYMEEAAEADNVIILDAGRIVAQGTPHELKKQYASDRITLYGVTDDKAKSLGVPYEVRGDAILVEIARTSEALALMDSNRELFEDFEITKGGMDDVFLAVTGKKLEGDMQA